MNRESYPPAANRGDALGQLKRERWHAANAKETARVAELDRRIQQLSAANTATAPARETAASTEPRATAARDQNHPKGKRHVSARRPA